jgi:antitoxin HicB
MQRKERRIPAGPGAGRYYSIVIQWSNDEQAYVVLLPEWADQVYQPVTNGSTIEEAARKGQEILESLSEQAQHYGEPLPQARTCAGV